jgi:hypothetical protein
MKNTFILLITLFLTLNLTAQENEFTVKADPNAGVFKFVTEVIDYGNIEVGADGFREFEFTNVGKAPIIISRAKSTCGCTVPNPPKKPIMPGESAKIGVQYNTKKVGKISKSIMIYSNASEKVKVLKIKGNVVKNKKTESLETPKPMMSVN